jgi:hypothetical protein
VLNDLELSPLPELRFPGLTGTVADESEIRAAAGRLLERLHLEPGTGHSIQVAYDGTTDPSVIAVYAGSLDVDALDATADGLTEITIPGAETAVSVTYAEVPTSVADAWLAIDSRLEAQRLRTTGPFRHTLNADGTVTLAAPVIPLTARHV